MRQIGLYLMCALLLAACARTPDEQRIRNAMTTMQHAVETHDLHGFMNYMSPDFIGHDVGGSVGEVDNNGLANLLRIEVLRNDQVGVTLGLIEVELQNNRATVHVTATLTGGTGGLLPEHGAIYSIASGWKQEGKEWHCYNATWSKETP